MIIATRYTVYICKFFNIRLHIKLPPKQGHTEFTTSILHQMYGSSDQCKHHNVTLITGIKYRNDYKNIKKTGAPVLNRIRNPIFN